MLSAMTLKLRARKSCNIFKFRGLKSKDNIAVSKIRKLDRLLIVVPKKWDTNDCVRLRSYLGVEFDIITSDYL